MSDLRIGVILGSTRPGRKGDQVANWVLGQAGHRDGVTYELVDLAEYSLPHLDEAIPASQRRYANEHTKAWAEAIASYDGFVFVTPEYNHSTSGALKNAIDFIYAEWNNKAAAFVSYGVHGGVRAVEHLRLIVGELQIADVRQQVAVSLVSDFEGYTTLKELPHLEAPASVMFDQLESWSRALRSVRSRELADAA